MIRFFYVLMVIRSFAALPTHRGDGRSNRLILGRALLKFPTHSARTDYKQKEAGEEGVQLPALSLFCASPLLLTWGFRHSRVDSKRLTTPNVSNAPGHFARFLDGFFSCFFGHYHR